MPAMSLEELLKSSLEGVNRALQEADRALHAEVASASDALSKISGGAIQVKLDPQAEDEDGVTYRLFVERIERNKVAAARLGFFRVSQKGYPILFNPNAVAFGHNEVQEISDSPKLKAFFHEMASNQDSPLIQKVAYLMRMKHDSTPDIPS